MTKRSLAVALLSLLSLLLAGCGGSGSSSTGEPASSPTTTAAEAAPTSPPEPTGEALTSYLAAVRKVGKSLATDEDQAVRYGRDICLDVAQDKPAPTVRRNAAARFEVETADAKRLVAAAQKYICPE